MWKINRINRDTLLNISKYSNKVIKLAKYFQESNQPFIIQELMEISNQTDQIELLEAFDKDIKKTVSELHGIQKLLITVDEEGNVKELKNDDKNLKSIFNENYDLENQTVKFPSAILDLRNPKAQKDLKKEIIENILDLSPEQYKQLMKIKDTLKDVNKEELANDNEKINYLINKSNIDFVKDSVEKINQYVKSFVDIRKNLNFEEKELIDKRIVSGRTMIDGILDNSTVLMFEDDFEKISPQHLKDNENAQETIEEIKKELKGTKLKLIEIHEDADLEKSLFMLKQLKSLNLNLTEQFEFKIRKIKNYSPNGIYLDSNDLYTEEYGYHNIDYNIVALDVDSPSSMIYELTNYVGSSNKEFADSPVRRAIALHFKSKVNSNILQENKSYNSYINTLKSTKKVMARLGEIGYILNKYDYKGHENKEDLMSFFDKVRLMEKMEHKGEKEMPIVHKIDFYRKNSTQYFDLDNLHQEELKIIKEHFKSYYNTINEEFSPLENTSILRTLEKLKEEQKLKEIQKEILEAEKDEEAPKIKRRKYDQEENPVSKINLDNIDSILEYNDKDKLFTEKELCEFLSENIYHLNRRKYSLTVGEAEDKVKIFESILNYGKKTNNKDLQKEAINAIALKNNSRDYIEVERLMNDEALSLRKLATFAPELSFANKKKVEAVRQQTMEKMLKSIYPEYSPMRNNFNHYINIDREEEEKVLSNTFDLLDKFDKKSVFLNKNILDIMQKFTELGNDIKNVINKENLERKTEDFFNNKEKHFKEKIINLADIIDQKVKEVALEKVQKMIDMKSIDPKEDGYNYNERFLSIDFKIFTNDYLLTKMDKIIDKNSELSTEDKLNVIKGLDFDSIKKSEIKNIFNDIKMEDLREDKVYGIVRENYIHGLPNLQNIVSETSIKDDFKNKDVNLNLISNIIDKFKEKYTESKIYNSEINKESLYEAARDESKDFIERNINFQANKSQNNLIRNEEKVVFIKRLNKQLIDFLNKKDMLEDFIDVYKKLKISNKDNYRYYNRAKTIDKLAGTLYMQGIDIESPDALKKLVESTQKQKGSKNKLN